ncbi:CbiX/SirB N-terminal domain-containing protein [Magnetospirillum sp. UT-4]|uniref:CbiX/SirB N-terminal domain-containing protein n=1 Tax=Magnetospirillum sp. UT-4 TaxID=2681467 RepID=UPI00137DE6AD|nr:CbiX/SirB N-terminal domain-containing protein [Magnetospirillum sp. UT-4]CAA7613399.1 conserved hypothetical protein [Magnetospirillum sp. UT-4]
MAAGRQAAIVLVGHGSARHPDSAAPVLALAEALRARGPWTEVRAAFMKQEPGLEHALDGLEAAEVVVVPVFAGQGYYTDTLIPRAMGLDGAVTRRPGRLIRYTAAAGGHPRIPGVMACRASGTATAAGMDPAATRLLLIAHGSSRPGGSGATPRAIAEAIAAMNHFAEVALAFLEQEPLATGWRDLVAPGAVVVLPLLVAQGMHASQDIPPLFGLTAGQTGPVTVDGRRVVLSAGLGAEPELVEIVAGMVTGALAG